MPKKPSPPITFDNPVGAQRVPDGTVISVSSPPMLPTGRQDQRKKTKARSVHVQGFGQGIRSPEFLLSELNARMELFTPGALLGIWWPHSGLRQSGGVVTRWRDARFPQTDNAWDWVFTGPQRPPLTTVLGYQMPLFDGANHLSDHNAGGAAWGQNTDALVASILHRCDDVGTNRVLVYLSDNTGSGRTRIDLQTRASGLCFVESYRLDSGGAGNITAGPTPVTLQRISGIAAFNAATNGETDLFVRGAQVGAPSTTGTKGLSQNTASAIVTLGAGGGLLTKGVIGGCAIIRPGVANVYLARQLIDQFWVDLFGVPNL